MFRVLFLSCWPSGADVEVVRSSIPDTSLHLGGKVFSSIFSLLASYPTSTPSVCTCVHVCMSPSLDVLIKYVL